MPRTRTKVRMDSASIANFTLNPQGMVSRFTRQVATETKLEAAQLTAVGANSARAHVGGGSSQGRMKDSYAVSWLRSSPRSVVWVVSNSRYYAAYVFQGHGPHLSPGGPMLVGKTQLVGRRLLGPSTWPMVKKRKYVARADGTNYPMMAVRIVYMRRGM